ncbi:glycosyltransferase family 4 protein [Zooshikella ganghwensis]|uniref:Glycosyltransferase family 1 protein n=1 Tax=Zooshikella ganghwensis TaxID=202772 RepID=A0A4V1INC1_9GAMM|nr:glycosyltransferase family 4 protein [Zooshikella ganghwensis]RDH43211.1 glycosyltransferase family 1 protein [Zooshikella ganghwensis]
MNIKLLFIVNDPAFFLSHRLPVALEAKKRGYDVHVATSLGRSVQDIQKKGFIHHYLPISRSGMNIINEIKTFKAILLLLRKVNPQLVHLVTLKPVLYGAVAARISKVPAVVAAVSGLGYIFTDMSLKAFFLRKIVTIGYYFAFQHPNIHIIFQNYDDLSVIQKLIALEEGKTTTIRGSGVDLASFCPIPEPQGVPTVVLASRMLKDKGVVEFVDAAKIVLKNNFFAKFLLIGDVDIGNPNSITIDQLKSWHNSGVVVWKGFSNDIKSELSGAHIVVLPSYREGLPKVLIEAAACGRAVITTDVPGCRNAIDVNKSGLLVPVKDSKALADAIEKLLLNSDIRKAMGKQGRKFAERMFDINSVVDKHLIIYSHLCSK